MPDTKKNTLEKADKLRSGADFARLRSEGVKSAGRYFLLVSAPPLDERVRCGVICGRKYSLLAVKRNRARRLLWETFRLNRKFLKPCDLVLITRQRMREVKRDIIQQEFEQLARAAGVWCESSGSSEKII